MRSQANTLASAMLTLARDIHCEDGVATAAITEAATRLLEQADEIARLRLTDAERRALAFYSRFDTPQNGPVVGGHAATLRGLLERL